jgi:hypothetical protein
MSLGSDTCGSMGLIADDEIKLRETEVSLGLFDHP